MWVDLPGLWIVIANIIGIPAIHLGISWIYTRMDRNRFAPQSAIYRERLWERQGRFYEKVFLIRKWKHLLPDAAPWFDGFAKGKLSRKDPRFVRDFIAETCRGESAHYAQIPGILLTLIWNPWPAAACVMIAYAFLSNLPCILLQRYTRIRMTRLLTKVE